MTITLTNIKQMTLNLQQLQKVIDWFPWVGTDHINELDKYLVNKLTTYYIARRGALITEAEATLIIRWFVHTPRLLRSSAGYKLQELLSCHTKLIA